MNGYINTTATIINSRSFNQRVQDFASACIHSPVQLVDVY